MGRKSDTAGSGRGSASKLHDVSKVLIAVALGTIMGAIWSFYQPHGLFSSSVHSLAPAGSRDELVSLKEQLTTLQDENTNLKIDLRRTMQQRDEALQQFATLTSSQKAGKLGTVKSLRTNPVVKPDVNVNPELAKLLATIAPNQELLVGIANYNVREMVRVWFTAIKRAGIKNYLLVALDDQIAEFCQLNQVPFYRRDAIIPDAQKGTGDNHAISGLKFHLLREFLVLGYSVLLSDVDILFFQNPFLHLYRDCDVEGMTDGDRNETAYGYDDVSDDPKMGWARYAHTMRIWVFNSGLFYIRPTIPSIELLDRVTTRLAKEKAWDQAVFNEELFFPSHPGYDGLHASKRVMDYYLFMNSKVMFTQIRKDPKFDNFLPVSLHVNYHPDKYERMVALVEYFTKGKKDALNRFPDGSA